MGFPHFMFSLSKFIFSFVLKNVTFCFSRIKFVSALFWICLIGELQKFPNVATMSLGVMRPGDCLPAMPGENEFYCMLRKRGRPPLQGSPGRIFSKSDNLHIH